MNHWLYSANVKIYDVLNAFIQPTVAWPASSNVAVGDTVYIYLSAPHKRIGFARSVEGTALPDEEIRSLTAPFLKDPQNADMPLKRSFMLLGEEVPLSLDAETGLTLDMLRRNGLNGMLMGPRKLENNPELLTYIRSYHA